MRSTFAVLPTASVVALLAAANQLPGRMIENRGQAMPKGAQIASRDSRRDRHKMKHEAALELMDVSRKTLVVAHLHPRWLRDAVTGLMDKGAQIDMAWVESLKAGGPEAAKLAVQVYG